MAQVEVDPQKQFQAAVSVIQNLPPKGSYHPSYEVMLRFYGLYKQATVGPCSINRPGFWDPVGRYKWDAWKRVRDMSKEHAMRAYVAEMKRVAQEVIDLLPKIENAEEMFQYFESLYEVIPDMPRPPASYFKKKTDRLQGTAGCKPGIEVNGPVEKDMSEELSAQQKNDTAKEISVEDPVVTSDSETEVYCDSLEQLERDKGSPVLANQDLALQAPHSNQFTSYAMLQSKVTQESSGKGGKGVKAGGPTKEEIPFEGVDSPSRRRWAERGLEVPAVGPHQEKSRAAGGSSIDVGENEGHDGKCTQYVQDKITSAVHRLQADMQNVALRLTRLEEMMTSQNPSRQRPPDVQLRTYLFLIFWPFVVYWLPCAYRQRGRS